MEIEGFEPNSLCEMLNWQQVVGCAGHTGAAVEHPCASLGPDAGEEWPTEAGPGVAEVL